MLHSQSLRVLLALAVGLGAGMLVAWTGLPALSVLVGPADVIGTLWTNAIRMTVLPLVAALTVTAVATTGGSAELRHAGGRALVVFLSFLLLGGAIALVTAEFAFSGFVMPAEVAERLRGSVETAVTAPSMPSLAQRLIDMVPANPIKAAADGALLPVVVFSLALGFALKQLPEARRAPVTEAARGISDAMLVVVGWVVAAAPVGVLALTFALGTRLGASSVGALARYLVTLSGSLVLLTVLVYPAVLLFGRVPLRRFIAAAAPAQALAAGSRSSLAALPLMIVAARDRLRLSEAASGFVLPLAVSVFRVNVPMAWVVGVVFLGKLYGIPVSDGALVTLVVTATLLSFSVPGIPSASLFLLSPVLVDLGLPAAGVGILIAVDVLPDMFKTLANVTSQLAAATIAGGRADPPPSESR